jgi:hypothetical protein
MDNSVRLHRLRPPLRFDQAITAEPVEYLIQVPDVQAAPLLADGLLETALQFVTVGRLLGQQCEHCVMQRHISSVSGRKEPVTKRSHLALSLAKEPRDRLALSLGIRPQ